MKLLRVGRGTAARCAVILALAVGLLVAGFSAPPTASAYRFLDCRGWGGTIDVYITVNESPTTSLMTGAEKWEPNTTGFNFEPAASKASRDMWANNRDFGATGWLGIMRDYNDINSPPNCYDNRWSANAMVSINTHYDTNYPARRLATAVHEFGHYLGLAHEDRTAFCGANGGSRYISIMTTGDTYNGACAFFTPQPDDINGINALF